MILVITFLSRRIADFLFQRNVISEEYVEICQYGYEVLFFNLFNALIVLVLGIILDKLLCSVVFFVIFALLRQLSFKKYNQRYTRPTKKTVRNPITFQSL